MSNANLSAEYRLRVLCMMNMQISAANDRATFESRASKFLVTNRTLSYSTQVSGTRKIWYQNAWHTSKVTGTRNVGGELGSCAMGLRLGMIDTAGTQSKLPGYLSVASVYIHWHGVSIERNARNIT